MNMRNNFARIHGSQGWVLWSMILTLIVLATIFAPMLSSYDPLEVIPNETFTSPDSNHLLGTDNLGRDVFSRLLYGGRISLSVSIFSVIISTVFGVLFGGISGYYGGWLDSLMMRFLDSFLAIPTLIIMLSLQAVIRGGVLSMIMLIGLTSWMTTARIVRSQFIALKEANFVKMAHVLGTPSWKIILHHLLQNSFSSIVIVAIFNCANAILTEATLSFLGIGIPLHVPSWGNMLYNAQNDILIGAWWIGVFPGMMIVISLLSINFLGESLNKKLRIQRG